MEQWAQRVEGAEPGARSPVWLRAERGPKALLSTTPPTQPGSSWRSREGSNLLAGTERGRRARQHRPQDRQRHHQRQYLGRSPPPSSSSSRSSKPTCGPPTTSRTNNRPTLPARPRPTNPTRPLRSGGNNQGAPTPRSPPHHSGHSVSRVPVRTQSPAASFQQVTAGSRLRQCQRADR